MNREEKIKEAYGEHWEAFKNHVDINGWIHDRDFWGKWPETNFKWETTDHDNDYYDTRRPLSLKGIESNNGWTKIESEDDLPEDEDVIEYWVMDDDEIVSAQFMHDSKRWYHDIDLNLRLYPSHYQPIQKPLAPLY